MDTWWQTETGMFMITPVPVVAAQARLGHAPFFGHRGGIVDEEGKPVADGEEGYLVLKTPWPAMLRTHLRRPRALRAAVLVASTPASTSPATRRKRDKDGYFWIIGRVDDVIKVSGYRLGTAEIEIALVSHPAVAEAAAIGLPHEVKGNAIHAYVILRAGSDGQRRSWPRSCAQHVGQRDGPDRQAREDQVRGQAAQDPLGQDHAPGAEGAGAGPARGRRLDAGGVGDGGRGTSARAAS